MEITWHSQTCFKLSERGMATVLTDPAHDSENGKMTADILVFSQKPADELKLKAQFKDSFLITGPGEYEVGNVFITGLVETSPEPSMDKRTIYVFNFDGIKVAFLGGTNRVPSQSEVEELGDVHILLIPISGENRLNAVQAAEVVNLISANIVIPIACSADSPSTIQTVLGKFFKEMGIAVSEAQPSFKIGSVRNLPEVTQIIVLEETGF